MHIQQLNKIVFLFLIFFATFYEAKAQVVPKENFPLDPSFDRRRITGQDTTQQKLEHRDPNADSITISYHYFDSGRTYKMDTSIKDFYKFFPVPYYYVDLGNFGNAAKSLIFSPYMQPGFDVGFHSYDIYNFTTTNTRFFSTTRPFTQLGYMLGSKSEQMINILHTQNRKSNINFTFEYRMINAPGAFKNQNTNHNNLRINLAMQSDNKRYGNEIIFISNKIRSSENGGIQSKDDLTGLSFNDPFGVKVRLGNAYTSSRNFFSTTINTGTLYDNNVILLRQHFDFGQKDSLVTDSITIKLYHPRLRLQHTVSYSNSNYVFQDILPVDELYENYYNYLPPGKVYFRDKWEMLENRADVISYPQKNNMAQFLKLGAGYEMIAGGYYPYLKKYNNIYVAAEYRNRTRNKKWDLAASGKFYSAGNYAGDYEAALNLERVLNNQTGSLLLGFENVNRSASSIFSPQVTSFPVFPDKNFKKQNLTKAFTSLNFRNLGLALQGEYYIITNYIYFDDFYQAKQQASLFNVLHVGAEKKLKLAKHINWYIEAHLQKATGSPPVNLPLFISRNRLAFEGNFFKNLYLSTGLEVEYYSPYHADNYSPFNGQFFVQDSISTSGNLPKLNAYLNFRIKSFKGFLRLENINSVNPADKFNFTRYNFGAPYYPQRPIWFRFGIWWNFVN